MIITLQIVCIKFSILKRIHFKKSEKNAIFEGCHITILLLLVGSGSISGQLIWTPEFLKPGQRAIENSIKV